MFESSKYLYKRLYITRSSILEEQGTTDIGPQLMSSVLSLDLNTVGTFAIFMSSRNILFLNNKVKRYCKGSLSLPKQLVITLKLISSYPGHLFVFIEKKLYFNSLTIIGLVGIIVSDFGI